MDALLGIILGTGSFIAIVFCASRLIAAMVRNRPKLPPLSEYRLGDCRLSKIINRGE
jgi:hypothetical protein